MVLLRSFRPKNPGPDSEMTSSRDCPLIGPALVLSKPPFRGMGPAAGAKAAAGGAAATAADGAPPPGVSRAVDWPSAPCTSVTVLLFVSRGVACSHRACSGVSRRPGTEQHDVRDPTQPTWDSAISLQSSVDIRFSVTSLRRATRWCVPPAHKGGRARNGESGEAVCQTYRRDVGARRGDAPQEDQGARPVVLNGHQERPVELHVHRRRVRRPKTSCHLLGTQAPAASGLLRQAGMRM